MTQSLSASQADNIREKIAAAGQQRLALVKNRIDCARGVRDGKAERGAITECLRQAVDMAISTATFHADKGNCGDAAYYIEMAEKKLGVPTPDGLLTGATLPPTWTATLNAAKRNMQTGRECLKHHTRPTAIHAYGHLREAVEKLHAAKADGADVDAVKAIARECMQLAIDTDKQTAIAQSIYDDLGHLGRYGYDKGAC